MRNRGPSKRVGSDDWLAGLLFMLSDEIRQNHPEPDKKGDTSKLKFKSPRSAPYCFPKKCVPHNSASDGRWDNDRKNFSVSVAFFAGASANGTGQDTAERGDRERWPLGRREQEP